MKQHSHPIVPRRSVIGTLAAAPVVLTVGLALPRAGEAQPRPLAPTPGCGEAPTPRNAEGPFFSPGSPRRQSLIEPGIEGTRLVVAGVVLSTDCRPLAGALLDFWQADPRGRYDNDGFRLRGHQFADEAGRYRLETIYPGEYGPRTPHIHVKVQAPGGPLLTTQLYFPGEARNAADGLFRPELVVAYAGEGAGEGAGREARFDFVLPA